jgi:hypothetical protein
MVLPARADLVLRFGLEITGVMALVQLSFRRPAGAIDHSPALDGRALANFLRPARQVFIFVRLQERARVVVGTAVQHAVAVPRPDRHIGDRIFVADDELIARNKVIAGLEANILGLSFIMMVEPPIMEKSPSLQRSTFRPGQISVIVGGITNIIDICWEDTLAEVMIPREVQTITGGGSKSGGEECSYSW